MEGEVSMARCLAKRGPECFDVVRGGTGKPPLTLWDVEVIEGYLLLLDAKRL